MYAQATLTDADRCQSAGLAGTHTPRTNNGKQLQIMSTRRQHAIAKAQSPSYHIDHSLTWHEFKYAVTANQEEWVGWRQVFDGKLWLSTYTNCLSSCRANSAQSQQSIVNLTGSSAACIVNQICFCHGAYVRACRS